MKNLFGVIFSVVFLHNLYGQLPEMKLKQLIKDIDRIDFSLLLSRYFFRQIKRGVTNEKLSKNFIVNSMFYIN